MNDPIAIPIDATHDALCALAEKVHASGRPRLEIVHHWRDGKPFEPEDTGISTINSTSRSGPIAFTGPREVALRLWDIIVRRVKLHEPRLGKGVRL